MSKTSTPNEENKCIRNFGTETGDQRIALRQILRKRLWRQKVNGIGSGWYSVVVFGIRSCYQSSTIFCDQRTLNLSNERNTTHQQDSSFHDNSKTSVLDLELYFATVTSFESILPLFVFVISVCRHVLNPTESNPGGTSTLHTGDEAPLPIAAMPTH
jgi:hypothetical protein